MSFCIISFDILLLKLFNKFTVIHYTVVILSSQFTAVLMVILQHLFWEKNYFFA